MGAGLPESVERRAHGLDDVADRGTDAPADAGPDVAFRPMAAGDVPRIGTIERVSFSRPWKEETFRRLLDRDRTELWVAVDPAERVVGYYVLWSVMEEAELANIAVDPEERGRGVGAALLGHATERARKAGVGTLFLEVRTSNEAAASLYRSRGFHVVAVRREYYNSPKEDALVMLKSLL